MANDPRRSFPTVSWSPPRQSSAEQPVAVTLGNCDCMPVNRPEVTDITANYESFVKVCVTTLQGRHNTTPTQQRK